MTTDEFIKKQQEKIDAIIKNDKPLLFAVRSVMALQSNRIFTKGLNKSGAPIGSYVGGELYVTLATSPKKFTPKGKPGSNVEKKNRKTGYFQNYLTYKKTIGKNKTIQTVDLKLSNELNRNWANGKVLSPQATKVNVHQYNVELSENNINKVQRYGVSEVFGLSKFEKDSFFKVLNDELILALK